MRFAGKTALITRATSGIGEAAAVMFAEEGAVAVIGRNADRGHAVQEQIRSAAPSGCPSHPGTRPSHGWHEDAKKNGMSWDEHVRWAVEDRPIARMASPDEVARAVLFLASEESSFITSAALPVDDGGVAGY